MENWLGLMRWVIELVPFVHFRRDVLWNGFRRLQALSESHPAVY